MKPRFHLLLAAAAQRAHADLVEFVPVNPKFRLERSVMRASLWYASILTLTSAAAFAAPQATYPPFSSQRISAHVRILASDAFEGRSPGTPGEDKTVSYIVSQFKSFGLKPGGPHGSWTQPLIVYRLTHVGPVTASIRLGQERQPLEQVKDVALNSTIGDGHVKVQDAPLVFVGYGIAAPGIGWDDFKGVDLKGKVALALTGEPDGEPFGGPEISTNGSSKAKTANLLARGAVGVLWISPETKGAWNSRANSQTAPQYSGDDSTPTLQFSGFIRESIARRIFASEGYSLDTLTGSAASRSFRPAPLKAAISVQFDIAREKKVTHNVIAMVPGRKRPNETLLYTAHWDHLGRGRPDASGDDIYNGAMDNASGVAGLLELARAFALGPRPERRVVFMATTGEELGFWGSRYYVDHPLYPLETTVADINMDVLSMLGPSRTAQVTGFGKTTLDYDQVPRLAAKQGRGLDRTLGLGGNIYNRNDGIIFARQAGVPMLDIAWGTDRVDPSIPNNYMTTRYHTPKDEWTPELDFRGAAQNLQLIYWIGRELANSTEWPEWLPGTEFKPLRDRSAAERRN